MSRSANIKIILGIFVIINAVNTQKVKECTTKEGTDGKCVPSANCMNGTIITNGDGLVDPRFSYDLDIAETVDSVCDHYLEECCSLNKVRQNRTVIPTVVPVDAKCGIRKESGVGIRIMGGTNNEAEYGEFPWMVGILQKQSKFVDYLCGGSLIAENVVLTAAHCLNESNLNDIIVRAGEYDSKTTNELFPHTDYAVEKVVFHERFYRGALLNDIALLFLETKAVLNDVVSKICLPSQDQDYDYKNCIATGWGKDKFGKKGLYQSILKKIELPAVPFTECEEMLKKTRLSEDFILDPGFMCAGGEEGIDTCKGDGGSPLVCPIAGEVDQYYQAGIVSWGIECGNKDVPGVYVNVAKYRGWIDEQINKNS